MCDRWRNAPEYIRDPWILWDQFPCPPPGTPNKARLLIELDWIGRLGPRYECKALHRVASRCKVDLTSVELSSDSLSDCDELFTVFVLCGTQCVIAIILACICLVFLFLLVIICCRYVSTSGNRKTWYTLNCIGLQGMTIVRKQLQSFDFCQNYYRNVVYQYVETTDFYRPAKPYKKFTAPGQSSVTIRFGLSGAEDVTRIALTLNHCRTFNDGIVDIIVNGTTVIQQYRAPRDNFGSETINLAASNFNPHDNSLTIQLAIGSPGANWLSDATVYVERQVNDTEADTDKTSRDIFVCLRNLTTERKSVISNLRKIADDLDDLHQKVNFVKTGGSFACLGGSLLMMGGVALEKLSVGTATPLVAAMEGTGLSLVFGGTSASIGAEIMSEVKRVQKNFEDDNQYCEKLKKLDKKLRYYVFANQNALRKKVPSLQESSIGQLKAARLMMSASRPAAMDLGSLLSKGSFEELPKIFEILEQKVRRTIMRRLGLVSGAVLTIQDLMKTLADISKGSPSEMAGKLRTAASSLEVDVSQIEQFMQDSMTSFLESLTKELQSSNLLSVSKIIEIMPIFDGLHTRYGAVNMEFLNSWNNYESTLDSTTLDILTNILNQAYTELIRQLKDERIRRQQIQLDFVIVAHGSIGAPSDKELVHLPGLAQSSLIPLHMHFATHYLSSIAFYQPWGLSIDARANYGIVNGSIKPSKTSFVGVGHPASFPNILPNFNVLQSDPITMIPTTWCNGIDENDTALQELLQMIDAGGTVRPYVWWTMGSVPSFVITALASLAAMVISIETGNQIDLRVRHGICLNWPYTHLTPPAELVALNQYYNAVGEVQQLGPFIMTIPSTASSNTNFD